MVCAETVYFSTEPRDRRWALAQTWPTLIRRCPDEFADLIDWAGRADGDREIRVGSPLLTAASVVISVVQEELRARVDEPLSSAARWELFTGQGTALAAHVRHGGRKFALQRQTEIAAGPVLAICVGSGVGTGETRDVPQADGPPVKLRVSGCGAVFPQGDSLHRGGRRWPMWCPDCHHGGRKKPARTQERSLRRSMNEKWLPHQ